MGLEFRVGIKAPCSDSEKRRRLSASHEPEEPMCGCCTRTRVQRGVGMLKPEMSLKSLSFWVQCQVPSVIAYLAMARSTSRVLGASDRAIQFCRLNRLEGAKRDGLV